VNATRHRRIGDVILKMEHLAYLRRVKALNEISFDCANTRSRHYRAQRRRKFLLNVINGVTT